MDTPVDIFEEWFIELSDSSVRSSKGIDQRQGFEKLILLTADPGSNFIELLNRSSRKGFHLGLPI